MAEEKKTEKFRPFRSVTRLLIGGIVLGSELLDEQLRTWETSGEQAAPDIQKLSEDDPLPETLPAPQVGDPVKGRTSDLRYAMIGLIFESEEKLEQALAAAKQIGGRADRVVDPVMRPIKKIGNSRPVQQGIGQVTSRSQKAINRWISRGREEETHSRQLTQQATTSTIDQSILYMAENEAITELIEKQGVSLAGQILELVRAISINADYYFEGVIRYILRMQPRYLLPPPSQEVKDQASWVRRDIRPEES